MPRMTGPCNHTGTGMLSDASCFHKDIVVIRQLRNTRWLCRNKAGFIRLIDNSELVSW